MMSPHRHHDRFKQLFDEAARKAGKNIPIPYFIALIRARRRGHAHLALWLREPLSGRQVQNLPAVSMAVATAMYHSAFNLAARVRHAGLRLSNVKACASAACTRRSCATTLPRIGPLLREPKRHGPRRPDRPGKHQLVRNGPPAGTVNQSGGEGRQVGRKHKAQKFTTKGLHPVRPEQ